MQIISEIFFLTGCMLFIFAPVCFCTLFFDERPERAILPTLIINSVIYYFLAVFHIHSSGFIVLYILNMLLYIPVIIRIKKDGWHSVAARLATPGSVCFLITSVVCFFVTRNMILASWDSISHWGKVVKFLMQDGKLGCEYPVDILMHASYPPGCGITEAMLHNCFFNVEYSEGIFIFTNWLINFAALIWLLSFFKWHQLEKLITTLIVMSLVLPFLLYLDCFSFGLSDSILILTMTLAFYQMVAMKDFRKWDLFVFAILTSWLFMLRDAGWGYALGLMAMWFIILIAKHKKIFYTPDAKLSAARCVLAALPFILPLLLKLSWKIILAYYQTPMRFSNSINFPEAFAVPDGYGWQMLKRFLLQLVSKPLFFWLLIITCGIILSRKTTCKDIAGQIKQTLIFFSAALLIYLVGIFMFYCKEFTCMETFPSFARYMNGFLLIPFCVLLLIAADNFSRFKESDLPPPFPMGKNIGLFAAFSAVLSFAQLQIREYDNHIYVKWRAESDHIKKYDRLLREPGASFMIITSKGCGFKSFYMSYLYPEKFIFSAIWDPVLPDSKAATERIYSRKATPQELRTEFSRAEYVFFDNPEEDFFSSYRELFAPGIIIDHSTVNYRLFKVTPDGLVPVNL